jgi:putative phosphoribosyl transferase
LIVGGADSAVLRLNTMAAERLGGPRELRVVPGATHLFEEPGTLAAAAALARDWFLRYLPQPPEQLGHSGTVETGPRPLRASP